MRLKFRTLSAGPSGTRHPGSVHEIPDAEARALLKAEAAIVTEEPLTTIGTDQPVHDRPALPVRGELVKVKFLTTSAGPHGVRMAGTIHEIPKAEADALIAAEDPKERIKYIELVKVPAKPAAQIKQETPAPPPIQPIPVAPPAEERSADPVAETAGGNQPVGDVEKREEAPAPPTPAPRQQRRR